MGIGETGGYHEDKTKHLILWQVFLLKVSVIIDDQPPEEGKEEPGAEKGNKEEKMDITPLRNKHL